MIRRRRHQRGFTLIELMTAIAIFGILAGMLFQMVRGGLDIWKMGESNRESLEKGSSLLDEIASELRMVRADSPPGTLDAPVRMLSDFGLFDLDMDGVDESWLQRFRFVRSCPEERFDERIREAGDVVGGNLEISDTEAVDAATRPSGGMAEVGYSAFARPEKKRDPALLTLMRWFRTPIGGEQSLFADGRFDDTTGLFRDGVVLSENILYLGVEFWSRDTESWESAPDEPGGPMSTWDSTRAVLLDDEGKNRFPLARGPGSLSRSDDDVFPRRVRITLVVARDDDEQQEIRLDEAISSKTTFVKLSSARTFSEREPHKYIKVGGEWMRWTSANGRDLKVERGVRNTGALDHAKGAPVHIGETYRRTVDIPVFREDWNDA